MKKETKKALVKIESLYLEYLVNFLTVERFAEHFGLTTKEAEKIIDLGRCLNHSRRLVENETF